MEFKCNNKDSLKRALVRDYPGAGSLQEALAQARGKPYSEPVIIPDNSDNVINTYRSAVSEIEMVYDHTQDYDSASVARLALGLLQDARSIDLWRDGWLSLIETHNDDLERF